MTRIDRRRFQFSAAASVIAMWSVLVGERMPTTAVSIAILTDDVGNILTDDSGVALTGE
jgi:hypothetical protein